MSTKEEDSAAAASKNVAFEPVAFAKQHPLPDYAGEICIVTGGATGIGSATCTALVQAGAKAVYNIDIAKPKDDSSSLSDDQKQRLHHVACDVSKPDALKAAIQTIGTKEGKIDCLVSNAGVWLGGEQMEDITEAQFDRVVNINVKGCFFAIAGVIPFMKKQKSGSIVVVGSDQSFVGKATQNLYGLTKAAVAQLAKSTAVQYAPDGIRVNCVCPGTIDTPLMRGAVQHFTDLAGDGDAEGRVKWLATAQPYPRLGEPTEVAHTIAFVLKMPFMVGAQVQLDGGYTAQ